jgi:hypothetical protein
MITRIGRIPSGVNPENNNLPLDGYHGHAQIVKIAFLDKGKPWNLTTKPF